MSCQVMGIVNVTPDSFSDGGRYYRPEEAARRVRNMIEEGADIIDLGAESTRPDATPLAWRDEWARLEPVLSALVPLQQGGVSGKVRFSVDTYHPETAERALRMGVHIINCVRVEPVADIFRLCADAGAEIVFPVQALASIPEALRRSVPHYLDPMIGFGTTREEDLARLQSVAALARQGRVLVGASRKRIVKKLTGEKVTGKNLGGNLAIAVWCALAGASVVRVHDVRETVQALRVFAALQKT